MQYQMSGASVPSLVPPPAPVTTPVTVQPTPKGPKKRRIGLLLIVLILAGAAASLWLKQRAGTSPAGPSGPAQVRTAVAFSGGVDKTIRVTGTTGAESFAGLIAPQIRGSRSGYGRDGRSFGSGSSGSRNSGGSSSSGSSGGSRNGGSSSESSTAIAGAVGSGPAVSSTSGMQGTGGMSNAMRSSTSRVSRGTTTPRSTTPSSTSAGGVNSSLGSEGLGSTSSSLMGGGTGGSGGGGGGSRGGGDEFGLILQTAANPGSRVKKGDVVAEFDRQSMQNRLDDYRASVAQTEAAFTKLQAELEVTKKAHNQTIAVAKADLDKAREDLKATPVLGAIESERLRLAAEEAEAKYKQLLGEVRFVDASQRAQRRNAELELKQMQLELKRSEANADRMLIKTPIDGLTVMQNTFRGTEFAQIQPGDQLWPGMRFMQVVDLSSMVVNASVNQVDIESVRIGAKAKVRFDAFPDLELPAYVYSIGAITRPGGMRANYVKEIPITLKLEKTDSRVIPDLSVSCDIVIEKQEKATVAPLAAVFYETGAKSGDAQIPFLYVRNGETWIRRRVELGLASNTRVAILSGLKPGEVVALEAPPQKEKI